MKNQHPRTPSLLSALRSTVLLFAVALTPLIAGCPGPGDNLSEALKEASECDVAADLDQEGQVIFPEGATDIGEPVDVDEDMGLLADLYEDQDTSTDAFYGNLPCEPSLGGTLPAEVPPTQDELDAETYLTAFESAQGEATATSLLIDPMPAVSQLAEITFGGCLIKTSATDKGTVTPCDSALFLDSSQPFEGRDIIYVHGLATKHLEDRIKNPQLSPMSPAHASFGRWPQDSAEYLNAGGYFRVFAEDYWKDHIHEHLGMGWQWSATDATPIYRTKPNRYMLVAWSSNQTMEFAQHALLTQIQMAIANNTNVVTPPSFPVTQVRPFCSNGCIIITHSTGSPIVTTAMSLAKVGFFGLGGKQIPNKIAAHISFSGAISGSRLASIVMALALGASPSGGVSNILCPIINWMFNTTGACNSADLSFVHSSIMRDLMPVVMHNVWGDWLENSPVPTVTFAGAHPIGGFIATGIMLPGLDDGVVNMNSACGNPTQVYPGLTPPGGIKVTSLVKAFDMTENGARLARSVKVFANQKNLKALASPNYLAGMCSPWLSPTGMVMPVDDDHSGTIYDARKRYSNHYSFVQHMGEHSYDGGSSANNPWPSSVSNLNLPATIRHYKFFGVQNVEESSAVTNPGIYTRLIDGNGTHLVKHIGSREIIRGRKIGFRLFKKWRWRWFWKRTYHVLDKGGEKQSSHYAYEFVGRR